MTEPAYSVDALAANRAGQLSPDQTRHLRGAVQERSSGVFGYVVHRHDSFAKDVAAGKLDSIEGAITKKVRGGRANMNEPPDALFELWVANRTDGNQHFKSFKQLYRSAPSAGFVRLFYLPKSRYAVNWELIDTAPDVDHVEQSELREMVEDVRSARAAHDEVGEAEARANLGSMAQDVASYFSRQPSPAQDPLPRDRVHAAVIGEWHNPFLSASVRADGTLTARMGMGGEQSGRWSVESDGRVRVEVMGASGTASVSAAGDELTLETGGRAMKLRRAGGS
jgi:hypothetical protein